MTKTSGPRIDEHRARREYLCGDPDRRGCDRRILAGDVYVEISHAPFSTPARDPSWIRIKCCASCRPPATATSRPCPIGSAGQTCVLLEGHLAAGKPHEYSTALF